MTHDDGSAKQKPLVSIIIAVYNDARGLRATLSSISRQRDRGIRAVEVIVVDGASQDGTVEIARNNAIVDILISEPDRGIYDAMTKGAVRAKGTWLHFLNAGDAFADDWSLHWLIQELEKASQSASHWAIAKAYHLQGTGTPQAEIRSTPHRWALHAYGLQPHCHQATWFRRSTFHEIGGYADDAGLVGDYDLILRFGLISSPVTIDRFLIHYEGGGRSAKASAELPAQIQRMRRIRFGLTEPGVARRTDDLLHAICVTANRTRKHGGRVKRQLHRWPQALHPRRSSDT